MKIISKKDEFRILKLLAKIWVLSEGNHSIQNFGQIIESISEIAFLVGGETGNFECKKMHTELKLELDRIKLERRIG